MQIGDAHLSYAWVSQERVTDSSAKSSHLASRSSGPPYASPIIPMDNDDGISFKGDVIFSFW